ncbi:MAG TPA: cupin domain-containing protein [Dehalococcoidia bacterium]|nr:cupin domain-containing protein [Dehalococcoidia bacterium]
MRRVVTGHRNGKSVIVDNVEIAGRGQFGSEMIGVWETDVIPTIPLEERNYKKQPDFHFPKPGETYINIWSCPPDKEFLEKTSKNGVDVVERHRRQFGDDWPMHTTDTVDIDIILSGELWMELDDGLEVHLEPGDCVVQNGTRHAWHNHGTDTCIMASFLIGAKRT